MVFNCRIEHGFLESRPGGTRCAFRWQDNLKCYWRRTCRRRFGVVIYEFIRSNFFGRWFFDLGYSARLTGEYYYRISTKLKTKRKLPGRDLRDSPRSEFFCFAFQVSRSAGVQLFFQIYGVRIWYGMNYPCWGPVFPSRRVDACPWDFNFVPFLIKDFNSIEPVILRRSLVLNFLRLPCFKETGRTIFPSDLPVQPDTLNDVYTHVGSHFFPVAGSIPAQETRNLSPSSARISVASNQLFLGYESLREEEVEPLSIFVIWCELFWDFYGIPSQLWF